MDILRQLSSDSLSPVSSADLLGTDEPICENGEIRGGLWRRKGVLGSWKPYYFVLTQHFLCRSRLGAPDADKRQILNIKDCFVTFLDDPWGLEFEIRTQRGKIYTFRAPTRSARGTWAQGLLELSKYKNIALPAMLGVPSAVGKAGSLSSRGSCSSRSGSSTELSRSPERRNGLEGQVLILPWAEPASIPKPEVWEDEEDEEVPDIETILHATVLGNSRGDIVAINRTAVALFGYDSDEELVGKPLTELMPEPHKSLHDGYLFRHEKFGAERLLGNRRIVPIERKDRSILHKEIILSKLKHSNTFVAIFRDPPESE